MPTAEFIMFELIGNTITSIVWGIITSFLLTGMLFFIPGLFYSRYNHTIKSILVLMIGFLFFTIQSTLMIGGIKSKESISTAETFMLSLSINESANNIEQASFLLQMQQITAQLSDQYPLFRKHINQIAATIYKDADRIKKTPDLIQAITFQLQSQINRYIAWRVGWISGGVTLIVIFLLSSANKQSKNFDILRQSDIYAGGFQNQ